MPVSDLKAKGEGKSSKVVRFENPEGKFNCTVHRVESFKEYNLID